MKRDLIKWYRSYFSYTDDVLQRYLHFKTSMVNEVRTTTFITKNTFSTHYLPKSIAVVDICNSALRMH